MITVRRVLIGVQVIAGLAQVGMGVLLAAKDRVDALLDFLKDGGHDSSLGVLVACEIVRRLQENNSLTC